MNGETLVPLRAAVRWVEGRTGRRPHVGTLHRWATRGVRGITLEAVVVDGRRYTSVPSLERFFRVKPHGYGPIALPVPALRRRLRRPRLFRVTEGGGR